MKKETKDKCSYDGCNNFASICFTCMGEEVIQSVEDERARILKLIDNEVENESATKRSKAERYWTYEQELELLKQKIKQK